jgi:hypothetical protein
MALLCTTTAFAQLISGEAVVPGTSNIFSAGRERPEAQTGLAGSLPGVVRLPAGQKRVLQFDPVKGVVAHTEHGTLKDADGLLTGKPAGHPPRAMKGIVGFLDLEPSERTMVLEGVFLDDTTPADPPPAALQVTTLGTDFSPALRQCFPIGTGVYPQGGGRKVIIPDNATRLFMGFDDGNQPTLVGNYGHNQGILQVHYRILINPAQ